MPVLLGELTIPPALLAEIRAEAVERNAQPAETAQLDNQMRAIEAKRAKLPGLYPENDLDKETYRRQKTALDVQAD